MNYLEYAIMLAWLVFGWFEPSLGFTSGALIFYMLQIERGLKSFSLIYFILLLIGSSIMGHYLTDILPIVVNAEYKAVTPAISFALGLVAKIVLDIILTKKFIEDKFKK